MFVFADQDTDMSDSEGVHVIRMPDNAGLLSPILHTVPLLAALALRPDESSGRRNLYVGNVAFSLLLCWWVYL